MSFDGICVRALSLELSRELAGGRITKISQPEEQELILTIKNQGKTHRLLASASPSLPLVYLTGENKAAPLTAPNFCMLLRKYIGSGRIASVTQQGLERVITITIEHLNELGDEAKKQLHIELMGKYSNIIFCDEQGEILDAIRRVGSNISSVREVLPGRPYFVPEQQNRFDPFAVTETMFFEDILRRPTTIRRAIAGALVGFSQTMAHELAFRAGCDGDAPLASLMGDQKQALYGAFLELRDTITAGVFEPAVYKDAATGDVREFSVVPLHGGDWEAAAASSVSEMLYRFYREKNLQSNMKQRSSELRKQVHTLLAREVKKLDLQEKQLEDTGKADQFKLFGELLNAFGYDIPPKSRRVRLNNYYTGEDVDVPLDPDLSGTENAKRYFEKYTKQKRTREALLVQLEKTRGAVEHLRSIEASLDTAENEADLSMIRSELYEAGFTKKKAAGKKKNGVKSRPLHFRTKDGYDIYIGKNNYQNDEITFKMATGNDWWFHAKKMPGSHVLVKCKGGELPDEVFLIAAQLAGYYSSGRNAEKLEVDYLQKKNVKHPGGSAPGFVVYYTNYSMVIHPSNEGVEKIKE